MLQHFDRSPSMASWRRSLSAAASLHQHLPSGSHHHTWSPSVDSTATHAVVTPVSMSCSEGHWGGKQPPLGGNARRRLSMEEHGMRRSGSNATLQHQYEG